MQARQIGPFDYDSLSPEHRAFLQAITSDITENAVIIKESVARVGQRLIDAKALLPEGQWLSWLGSIGMSHSTASNYMNVASNWGGTGIVEKTDLAPLFIISTRRVSDEVRKDFADLVNRGEQVDADAAKALRDAPPTLRARYVMGEISKSQFVGLADEYKGAKNERVKSLIDRGVTDPEAVTLLAKLPSEVLEVAANTGHVNFDGTPVPVEKVTRELLAMHRWQTGEPKDDGDGDGDGGSNPPLLKGTGRVESIYQNKVVVIFDVDTNDLKEGERYTFTVR